MKTENETIVGELMKIFYTELNEIYTELFDSEAKNDYDNVNWCKRKVQILMEEARNHIHHINNQNKDDIYSDLLRESVRVYNEMKDNTTK